MPLAYNNSILFEVKIVFGVAYTVFGYFGKTRYNTISQLAHGFSIGRHRPSIPKVKVKVRISVGLDTLYEVMTGSTSRQYSGHTARPQGKRTTQEHLC